MTVQQVFNIAMQMIKKTTGGVPTAAAISSHGEQTPGIMTELQTELLIAENSASTPVVVAAMTDELLVTDRTAMLIMPYGLLSHLLLQQDPERASFFNDRYEELKRKMPPVEPVTITDVYASEGETWPE